MNYIGIDKTVVKNFTVEKVDYNKLLSESNIDNVVCLRNMQNKYNYFMYEEREDNFNTIIIKDNIVFNTFKADIKKIGNTQFIQYGVLDLSIREIDSNNLIPLSVNAYRLHIKKVFKYIQERYGVVVDMKEIKFEKLELNTTIELKEEFKEYIRVFDILMNLAPKSYREYVTQKDKLDKVIDYFLIKNNTIQCKFYNKSKQVEEVYSLETHKNILRIEYTLLNDKKIKEVFNSNEVDKLTDEQIKEFVKKQLTKDFINRYNKYKSESIKQLTKKAKELKGDNKQWVKSFIMYVLNFEIKNKIPLCLDVEHLKQVIKEMDKSNYSQNLKRIKKDLPSAYENQEEKIFEIFQKIEEL